MSRPRAADRDEAIEAFRHLDAREPLFACLGIADEQPEAQRQPRDVRERLPRPDGERGEHGEDLTQERALELDELVAARVVDVAEQDPFGCERRNERVAPQARLSGRQLEDAFADLDERLLRRPPVSRSNRRT